MMSMRLKMNAIMMNIVIGLKVIIMFWETLAPMEHFNLQAYTNSAVNQILKNVVRL